VSDQTKNAYRQLLYVAMLAIRALCPSRENASANPLKWRRQYLSSRVAGGIADWLHNLAAYSSRDFSRFDEEWFWKEHQDICRRFPRFQLERYREIFDECLAGKNPIV
jgi:hypothetical protein